MKAVVQRVREARVVVAGEVVGAIGQGLLVLLCAERGDAEAQADKLLAKLLKLRIFSDAAGKMNLSLQDVAGTGAGKLQDRTRAVVGPLARGLWKIERNGFDRLPRDGGAILCPNHISCGVLNSRSKCRLRSSNALTSARSAP